MYNQSLIMLFQIEKPLISKKNPTPPAQKKTPNKQNKFTAHCVEFSIVNLKVFYKGRLLLFILALSRWAQGDKCLWQVRGDQTTGFAEFLYCALSSL